MAKKRIKVKANANIVPVGSGLLSIAKKRMLKHRTRNQDALEEASKALRGKR